MQDAKELSSLLDSLSDSVTQAAKPDPANLSEVAAMGDIEEATARIAQVWWRCGEADLEALNTILLSDHCKNPQFAACAGRAVAVVCVDLQGKPQLRVQNAIVNSGGAQMLGQLLKTHAEEPQTLCALCKGLAGVTLEVAASVYLSHSLSHSRHSLSYSLTHSLSYNIRLPQLQPLPALVIQ